MLLPEEREEELPEERTVLPAEREEFWTELFLELLLAVREEALTLREDELELRETELREEPQRLTPLRDEPLPKADAALVLRAMLWRPLFSGPRK